MPLPIDAAASTVVLTIDHVGKSYATAVLHDVSLQLRAGEVLALTGENGAGKSTLAKIICGLEQASVGAMSLGARAYAPQSRSAAEHSGVRMVMQELSLIPTLTVAENLLLSRLPTLGRWRASWIDREQLNALAQQQLDKIGLRHIAPDALVSELGIGQQQMVEIARNLQDNIRVLVLDEPTAMLTPRETEHLFEQMTRLQAQGVAIIYVSHRLEEIKKIANTLAVLRDGHLVQVCPLSSVTEADIVQLMVGRAVEQDMNSARRRRGPKLLQARGLRHKPTVNDVSLDLYAGEVFGLAGLVGSGRTEVLRLLFGADRADAGDITLYARDDPQPTHRVHRGWESPRQAIAAGMGLITEDRKSQGLLLTQPIRINTTLCDVHAVARRGWLRGGLERSRVAALIERLSVRCRSTEQSVVTLSGGNQQKVVVARWLHKDCQVLLLDEPTRGVDVGARADIYAEMEHMAKAGRALLMVSSDLRELMQMSDRIGVMSHGRLVRVYERGEWSEAALLADAFCDSPPESDTSESLHVH